PNAVWVEISFGKSCHFNGFVRRNDGILSESVYFSSLFAIHELSRIEIFHFACEASFEFRCIKTGNWSRSTLACKQCLSVLFSGVSNRRQSAHSGYYYPFQRHSK